MTIASLFSLGTCIVQIQSVWVNFACTKRLFNLSAETIINARNAQLCVKCAKFPFEEQTNFFFLSLGHGVYIFEENLKSIQDVFGDVYCPGEYCINRKKCKSIGGYVTIPISIHGCDNCGAWLFVHKVLFTLQEHIKTTKTDKTRFFFAKKSYTTNNCSMLKSHFNQPNIERENCAWTTSRLLEMCIVPHVELKSVFTFQPIERLVSTTVKGSKLAATF